MHLPDSFTVLTSLRASISITGCADAWSGVFTARSTQTNPVDEGGRQCGTEAVVDIHYRQAAGAAIQHREQRGNTSERGAITDAGRHSDYRPAYQASDH
jgi:hypothetical protein